jgi:N6-adenosine-specific RNA methylase IME4
MLDFNKYFTYAPRFALAARQVPIESIHIGARHRPVRNLQRYMDSIAAVDLLQPVVIHAAGFLVAGARRLAAYRALGRREVPVYVIDIDPELLVRAEHDENVVREGFTPSEMVAIGEALEEMERAAAKARMSEGARVGKISTPSGAGRARDKVAASLGVSGKTYEKAKAIVKAAGAEPEKYGPLLDDMDRSGHIENAYRRLNATRQAEAIRAEPPPLPGRGPYRVITADPPWRYELRENDPSHTRIVPYPTMTIEQICAVDLASIAAKDCVLWLWTTNTHIEHAFKVLAAWGFEHKTMLTWAKSKFGTGYWLRGQTEHCIMAVRGKPTVVLTNQATLLHGPVREHSQKPDSFYALVESLCPAPRYAYLFARGFERPGWDCHGDQIARVAA